jgi:tetratricopeptide (TPR) repeat protein
MNSWHSWSPNGKWLVFSSKAYSIYTQLFLTHIDEQGQSTPPVVLDNFTEKDRAANIPEFANVKPGAIRKIREAFLDDSNYLRAGDEFRKQGEYENAIRWYRRALDINPNNAAVHVNWGTSLLSLGKAEEAKTRFVRAIELNPGLPEAHCGLGMVLRQQNRSSEAADAYREALRRKPDFAAARLHLGGLLLDLGRFDQAQEHLFEAVRLDPGDPFARFNLGVAYARQEKLKEAVAHFTRAIEREPNFVPALVGLAMIRSTSKDGSLRDGRQAVELASRACELTKRQNPESLYALAAAYAESGRYPDAVSAAETAMQTALASGNRGLAETIRRLLEACRQRKNGPSVSP